jgi:putative transposase
MKKDYWQKFEEKGYYHIYNRANGKDYLYESNDNFQYFLNKWQTYLGNYVDTVAYCLMYNHFHFVVQIKTVDNDLKEIAKKEYTNASLKFFAGDISFNTFLEDQFRRLFQSYSLAYNKQKGRHGSLFEPKFKRIQLRTLPRILYAMAYVHHNPMHHDYSPYYEGWTYSSYKAYLTEKPTKLAKELGLSLFNDGVHISEDPIHVSDTLKVSDTYVATCIARFLQYHHDFHEEWLKKQRWEDWEL